MSASEKAPLTQEKDGPLPYSSTEKGPAVTFVQPGQPLTYTSLGGPPPDDYLAMSILTIVFCFWPLGIVALFKSLEVRSAIARGDLGAAQRASRNALKYNKLSIAIGIGSVVFWIAFVLLMQLTWIIPVASWHPSSPTLPPVNETVFVL